jgi:hypothetical protein
MALDDNCFECGRPCYDWYMVRNHVWAQVAPGAKRRGVLHFSCLEKRLGRLLTEDDFTRMPINQSVFIGIRIGRASPRWES